METHCKFDKPLNPSPSVFFSFILISMQSPTGPSGSYINAEGAIGEVRVNSSVL